jgi:arsenate reductase
MLEGYLKKLLPHDEIYSAGLSPADKVHPLAVKVMNEDDVDISKHYPKSIDQFQKENFDYVITVCCYENKGSCPLFKGKGERFIHKPFMDPSAEKDSKQKEINFRKVRDEIKQFAREFISKLR